MRPRQHVGKINADTRGHDHRPTSNIAAAAHLTVLGTLRHKPVRHHCWLKFESVIPVSLTSLMLVADQVLVEAAVADLTGLPLMVVAPCGDSTVAAL